MIKSMNYFMLFYFVSIQKNTLPFEIVDYLYIEANTT